MQKPLYSTCRDAILCLTDPPQIYFLTFRTGTLDAIFDHRSPAKPIRPNWLAPFYDGGCHCLLVNYGGEFCRGCASTKRYGYCWLADMDAGASPNQHKNQLYFYTRRLYRCHAFGNHCKTHWKSMVLNLACVLVA